MPTEPHFRIAALYPDRLNIYADRGNLLFLQKRCLDRGFRFSIDEIGMSETFESARTSLVYIGGGQDRDQALCAEDLLTSKIEAIREHAQEDRPLLAVCGGYQLLGGGYQASSGWIPGLALAGLETSAEDGERLIGPVAIRTDLGGPTDGVLAGFENHAGRTTLDRPEHSLGSVISGFGNNGRDQTEGFRSGNLIGTYLHGPLLPKNWWLADWLIARGLALDPSELAPLEDGFERRAHAEACRAAGVDFGGI